MAAIHVLSRSVSDEQLVRLVRDGDERAFDCLYVRHLEALRRYTGRILRDESAAEDAVQVALMNAYRSLRAGRLPRAVQPWLFRIARNAAFAQCAQRKETLELPESVAARSDERGNDVGAELVAGIAQLPERQRHAFILRELRGLSVRETSEVLELGESQVEQLVFAAKARLAELLVFGGPASCELVQAIAGSSLDRQQRRALKRHVHHCNDCRASLGERMRLGSRLGGLLEGLRRAADLLGPASAAKVVAASSLAAVAVTPALVPQEHPLQYPTSGVSPSAQVFGHRSRPDLAPAAARPVAAPKPRIVTTVVSTTRVRAVPRPARPHNAGGSPAPTVTITARPKRPAPPARTATPVDPPVEVARPAPTPVPPSPAAPTGRVTEPSRTPAPPVEREPEPSPTLAPAVAREPTPTPAPEPASATTPARSPSGR